MDASIVVLLQGFDLNENVFCGRANDTLFRERDKDENKLFFAKGADETSAREICVVSSRSRCFEDSNSRRSRNHGWPPSPLTTRKSGGTLGNGHAKRRKGAIIKAQNKGWVTRFTLAHSHTFQVVQRGTASQTRSHFSHWVTLGHTFHTGSFFFKTPGFGNHIKKPRAQFFFF